MSGAGSGLQLARDRRWGEQYWRMSCVDRAIDFELLDQAGKTWHLVENLARGPVLLVFSRGDW